MDKWRKYDVTDGGNTIMATYYEVLHYLSSGKEFHSAGTTYEDIVWGDGIPGFTKEEFLQAFEDLDNAEDEKARTIASATSKLQALGLTEEEARAIAGL
jgi:hypothetical protein